MQSKINIILQSGIFLFVHSGLDNSAGILETVL